MNGERLPLPSGNVVRVDDVVVGVVVVAFVFVAVVAAFRPDKNSKR